MSAARSLLKDYPCLIETIYTRVECIHFRAKITQNKQSTYSFFSFSLVGCTGYIYSSQCDRCLPGILTPNLSDSLSPYTSTPVKGLIASQRNQFFDSSWTLCRCHEFNSLLLVQTQKLFKDIYSFVSYSKCCHL